MRVRLSSFLDAPVVVYFFPGGSPEDQGLARSFRDQWLRLHDRASMVIGVSQGDRILLRDFATAERLPFLLVADEDLAIARAFGVPVTDGRLRRVTFIVGKDGTVTHVFSEVNPEAHGAEVGAALEAAAP
jgi:peroxiredoxin Q/BCP